MQKILPYIWLDKQAEEVAKFYQSVFPNTKVVNRLKYITPNKVTAKTKETAMIESNKGRLVSRNINAPKDTTKGSNQMRNPYKRASLIDFISLEN